MTNFLKSKKVLSTVAIASALLLSACGGGTQNTASNTKGAAEEPGKSHNLIISHFLPGNHPIQTQLFEEFGKTLNEGSDGRITQELYPANSLGDAGAHYDMAVTGEADIALSVYGYTPGRFPSVSVLELPFLAESAVHGSKIVATLYNEFPEIQKEHSETHPLFVFTAEPAQLISVKHRIEKPEDLKGLRVRTPSPTGSAVLEALGATAVSMPMGDVYESLQRGVVDAAMVPLETLQNYNFHEIAKYVTIGNFSATPFYSVMNQSTYDSFSDSDKELLDSLVGLPMSEKAGAIFDTDGKNGLELAKKNGAEIIEFTAEQLAPWEEILKPVAQKWIDEMSAKGLPAQEIYNRAEELKDELK
ncbi:TRAP transporter substrate-binding protein [Schinkia azotoformans]|uniref:TRAP transporter substrate-binding protein n=1 Tax=Schinkia azotoformans TaxID=1454 RepID=UPI002DBFE213|nr:TRAP transporter substrate-binding protein [Schinkia azotoformans]MEC1697832.1 TRAP transporter substrate-binding protein [Schinkia azotoformans]